MNFASKVAPPRPLTHSETNDSLTQFKFHFNNFYRKDSDFKPILKSTFTWDGTAANYGRTADEADDLETLLGNVCSLLPFPYLNSRILKETKTWNDVWEIIFTHYQAKPSQDSNLDFVSLTLDRAKGETYLTFYERLCHHQRTHLAPAGAVGTGPANAREDTLTLSHQNLITQYWMQKIDTKLPARVAVEYATELQAGIQITALVQKIAKRADTLLMMKGAGNVTKTVTKVDAVTDDDLATQISKVKVANRNNSHSHQDDRNRREQRGGPDRKFGNQSSPYCPGCKYLGDQLKLKVMFNHLPSDCPRKTAVVNMLKGEDEDNVDVVLDVDDFIAEVNKNEESYELFHFDLDTSREAILQAYESSSISQAPTIPFPQITKDILHNSSIP